ncbi:MAG: ThiF family adenylyltransferase [Prevotellaceae bacterium]|nr:ThiF family adenylyltransferase [Candidatus Minthosoma caballi]
MNESIFGRQELLFGRDGMELVASKKVIVFGVGGVGSWCAESLIRSGVVNLTIVDSDRVSITNVNRQLMATTKTIDCVKVEVLKQRLLEINPSASINAIEGVYNVQTSASFQLSSYDYIIDAIDSLKDKANLILEATKTNAIFYSSMGAALKMDPSRISTAEFWKVKGCPLAAALRRKFKHNKTFPSKKFKCVYSDELLQNKYKSTEHDDRKAQINGSIMHATAIFGLTLSSLVLQDIYKSIQ